MDAVSTDEGRGRVSATDEALEATLARSAVKLLLSSFVDSLSSTGKSNCSILPSSIERALRVDEKSLGADEPGTMVERGRLEGVRSRCVRRKGEMRMRMTGPTREGNEPP